MVIADDGPRTVVRLAGRLDGEAADQLSSALDELLHEGTRSVLLDMSDVTYISSAGTKVLALRDQDFSALRGELRITNPSKIVLDAVRLVGLEDRLLWEEPSEIPVAARTRSSVMMHRMSDFTREDWRVPDAGAIHGHYEISTREADAHLKCRLYGEPAVLFERNFRPTDCHLIEFPDSIFGLGLGAIGNTPEDCLPRLGELVAVGGVTAYLPTDGSLVADYFIGTRSMPPTALLAYGMTCEGRFSHLARFNVQPGEESIPLSELARVALESTGGDAAGFVIAAETAGLVGTGLKRPSGIPGGPVPEPDAASAAEWLSFTPEPLHARMTGVVVGVAARSADGRLGRFLRPLDGGGLHGHFHAVVFPYDPLPQRTVAMQALVLRLFGNLKIRGLMHLLNDQRRIEGAGESRFLRGLCWVSPIREILDGAA
jgi:anti-anti-sigma factor